MNDSVTIKCMLRPVEFKLVEPQGCRKEVGTKYFQVCVRGSERKGHHFESHSAVCAYDPHNDIVQFFQDLAANRAGWGGERRWESTSCGITIGASMDTNGHVVLEVAMGHGKNEAERVIGRSLTDQQWQEFVQEEMRHQTLYVDAGLLGDIAAGVKEFVDGLDEASAEAGVLQLEIHLTEPADKWDDI